MTDLRKAAEQALEVFDGPVLKDATENAMKLRKACDALRQALAQNQNMPEQYVMVGRFMLQPHFENGYWLTDTGTCEAMQIFQPEMERVIKDLWKQF